MTPRARRPAAKSTVPGGTPGRAESTVPGGPRRPAPVQTSGLDDLVAVHRDLYLTQRLGRRPLDHRTVHDGELAAVARAQDDAVSDRAHRAAEVRTHGGEALELAVLGLGHDHE